MPLGLERGIVRLDPYNPTWPTLFNAERDRLHAELRTDLGIAFEHIGSTAVPGLAAKPILDLLGGYPSDAAIAPYIDALVRAGY